MRDESQISFAPPVACCKMPARLNAEQAAEFLGFQAHDVPVLVSNKLLKPLGKPAQSATKYFAAVHVCALASDPSWLSKATQAVSDRWNVKNARKRRAVVDLPQPAASSEITLAA